jgi:6-phosphogluconolactonase
VKLIVSKDLRRLASGAAAEFVRIANEAIAERGAFRVALSGGSTPRALYEKLVTAQLDWSRVYFFFGDERNVPADDERSNYRLAHEFLFRPLSIDPDGIYRWRTEIGGPDAVAEDYRTQIHVGWLKGMEPTEEGQDPVSALIESDLRFDLILLGMGEDGHTASLFPGTMALQFDGVAAANFVPQLDQWRYTLTFPVINNARNVMFLVAGAEKAPTLREVLEGDQRPDTFPVQSVQLSEGEVFWFVDKEAAAELTS